VSNRLRAVVALFGGLALMVILWVLMGTDPTVRDQQGTALVEGEGLKESPSAAVPPELRAGDFSAARSAADVANRQRMIAEVLQRGGAKGPQAPAAPSGIFALDQDGIQLAVQTHRKDLDACWQAAKAHDPKVGSDTTLAIEIQPAEKRSYATVTAVTSTLGELFDPCATTVMSGVPFGTTEATTLRYPIQFGG
jgi:hypothetical protein